MFVERTPSDVLTWATVRRPLCDDAVDIATPLLCRGPGIEEERSVPLIDCPDCGNSVSDAAPACPSCGRPKDPEATRSQPIAPAGVACPYCGNTTVGKVRGLQGPLEVLLGFVLLLMLFVPGIIYYVVMESVPYCSSCGRRVRKRR